MLFLKSDDSMTLRFGVLIYVCDGKPNDHRDYIVVYLVEGFRLCC